MSPKIINLGKLETVEFFIDNLNRTYEFKLWGNTLTSMFILVREDSQIIDHINVGETYGTIYRNQNGSQSSRNLNTKIKYFDKISEGRFKGHYLAGLSVVL